MPLVLAGSWRARLRTSLSFAAAALVPILALVIHNGVRLDDYAVVRGGGASLPLFRAFVEDGIVEPGNGPASRELAQAVQASCSRTSRTVRTESTSSGSSLAEVRGCTRTSSASPTGPGAGTTTTGTSPTVGREAVLEHPGTYARGVTRDFYRLLWWPLFVGGGSAAAADGGDASGGEGETIVVDGKELPRPSEGQPIPSSNQAGFVSTPDGRVREVWTSAIEHHLEFRDPADEARSERVFERLDELLGRFPDRAAREEAVRRLDQLSRWYPRPLAWLVLGLAVLLWRRPRGMTTPLVLVGCSLLLLLTTALAVYAVAEYSVPLMPAFILLAVAAMFAQRRDRQPAG